MPSLVYGRTLACKVTPTLGACADCGKHDRHMERVRLTVQHPDGVRICSPCWERSTLTTGQHADGCMLPTCP